MKSEKNTEELIQQNNRLRRQLTEENEEYYTNLLLYLRTAGLFYNEEEVELQLMEILQDILDAQAGGINAATYFGEEPQVIADQLISNFPKAGFKEKMKMYAIIFGISSLFNFIGQLSPDSNQINLLPFLLSGLLTLISVQGIFWFIHSDVYSRRSENKGKTSFIVASLFILLLSLFVGIQFLKPEALFFTVPNFILIGFSLSLPILFTGFTFFGKEKWRSLFLAMLPFVWFISSVYLFQRYKIVDFQSDKIGRYGLVIAILLSNIWFYFAFFREGKKEL